MISLSGQIYTMLKETGESNQFQVSFFYPKNWSDKSLPVVTFYEQKNIEAERVDNGHEYLSDVAYQIDVWAKTPEETNRIALIVNDTIRSIGLKREFSTDLYSDGIHHKSMRFGGKIQPDTETIYQ